MRKTLYIFIIFCINTGLFIQCQTKENTPAMQEETSDFVITPCQMTYKGQELPMGKPLEEWIKIFGKYDRDTDRGYVWDSLGIVINDWESNYKYIDVFYIFFMNLDSPLGKKGKLQYASNYYILTKEEEEALLVSTIRNRPYTQEELDKSKKKQLAKKPEYLYPFTTYSKPVDLQGAQVKAGMSLKEVNRGRSKVAGVEEMGYWDNDGNWSYTPGSTTIKTGEFKEQKDYTLHCPQLDYWYYITLRYSQGELEYLKVTYRLYEDN